jgi:hypothetical protein
MALVTSFLRFLETIAKEAARAPGYDNAGDLYVEALL